MEGNTLHDLVETHRELARESSVYENVRVDVEELAALLAVADEAKSFAAAHDGHDSECDRCRFARLVAVAPE